MSEVDMFEEWIKDNPYIYYEINFYISPIDKIVKFNKLNKDELPYINSNGFYGFEENGIMKTWIDNTMFFRNVPSYELLKEISKAYEFNKTEWLIKKRIEKINKIRDVR